MIPTDEALMRRVQAGDLGALGALFDRHHARLHGFLARMTGGAASAEDLVGEAFLRVWASRSTYDADRSFAVWLYTLARRLCMDELKKRSTGETRFTDLGAEGQSLMEEGVLSLSSCAALPPDPTLRWDLRSTLHMALQSLPPDQRAALALKAYDGYSYREIGEILGCSEGNARVLTHRARKALRPLLKEYLNEEEDPCLR